MRKRITLLGSILMAMALPLYADIPSPGHLVLDSATAALHLQIANALISSTGRHSILDTSGRLNPKIAGSSLTPVFKMNQPVAPVPEPTHYLLMGLGVIGLLLARRDRLSTK